MASMNMQIEIVLQRRRALYTPCVDRPALDLTKGVPVECRVWGCYQVDDCDGRDVYFVVELENGRCTHASIDQVQFIKEDDEC